MYQDGYEDLYIRAHWVTCIGATGLEYWGQCVVQLVYIAVG